MTELRKCIKRNMAQWLLATLPPFSVLKLCICLESTSVASLLPVINLHSFHVVKIAMRLVFT